MKKIELNRIPDAQELTPSMLESLEKLRKLGVFCSHDLRSMIGIVQTSLALFIEENPRPENETEELVHQGLKILRSAISKLDSHVVANSSPFSLIWLVSDRLSLDFKMVIEKNHCVIPVRSAEEALQKLSEYQPDALVIDSALKVKTMSEFIKACQPQNLRTYFLGEPRGLQANLLKKWGVAACWQEVSETDEAVRLILEHFKANP